MSRSSRLLIRRSPDSSRRVASAWCRRVALIALAAAASLLVGCYRTQVVTGRPSSGVHIVQLSHTFIGGLVGDAVPAPCEPAVVETRLGGLGLLLAIVTANIWVPLTVDVECAADAPPPGAPPPGAL
jgi:hypothetical protein